MCKHFLIVGLLCFSLYGTAQAQQIDTAYQKVALQRAEKITSSLNLKDKTKASHVTLIIANQYVSLNSLQGKRDAEIKLIAGDTLKAGNVRRDTDEAIKKIHGGYLSKLSKELTPLQVDKVKDGMTYNTVPLTYANYLLMLPYLTQDQQNIIKSYLIEAREKAIDGGSAKEKQQWFGKYKGRIANYLSGEGYQLKKEGDDWAKRRDTSSKDVAIARSNAIMKTLALDATQKGRSESVRNLIALQYQKIAEQEAVRKQKLLAISNDTALNKDAKAKAEQESWLSMKAELEKQKAAYLTQLSKFLNEQQVEQVVNAMTFNKLQQEYDHFIALLPALKADHKNKVRAYLLEARDNAMSVQTSREVNQWFAKYRGRANNYLAAQGFNLRQATEELERKTGKPQ